MIYLQYISSIAKHRPSWCTPRKQWCILRTLNMNNGCSWLHICNPMFRGHATSGSDGLNLEVVECYELCTSWISYQFCSLIISFLTFGEVVADPWHGSSKLVTIYQLCFYPTSALLLATASKLDALDALPHYVCNQNSWCYHPDVDWVERCLPSTMPTYDLQIFYY